MSVLASTTRDRLGDGFSRLQRLLAQAMALARGVETGLAVCPLRDHFQGLHQDLGAQALNVMILGRDSQSREVALLYLGGEALRSLVSRISTIPGLIEIDLVASGYALVASDQRRELDSLDQVWEAVRTTHRAEEADGAVAHDALHVQIAAPRALQRLSVAMTDSVATLMNDPVRSLRLTSRANLVVTAAPTGVGWDDTTVALVSALAAGDIRVHRHPWQRRVRSARGHSGLGGVWPAVG